ncbi:MAG: phenylalanine--tRNA ligase subunit alpha [Synergistales bacterium]|nr:phenylalanine--tRNA ligase subunit alpha [Synergistales bacterium]
MTHRRSRALSKRRGTPSRSNPLPGEEQGRRPDEKRANRVPAESQGPSLYCRKQGRQRVLSVWAGPGSGTTCWEEIAVFDKVDRLREECRKALEEATDSQTLNEVRVRYLGKKGELTQILRSLGSLPKEERPSVGQAVNALREEMEERFARRQEEILHRERESREEEDWIDVTLPPRTRGWGAFHPVAQVTQEVIDIFVGLGFSVATGPELEDDFHNFEALNIPPHHPARDMQDTFYMEDGRVLRTQTSPVQIRSMQQYGAPLRIICPGKVFRRDSDPTHSPMFHQLEGLLVDRDVSVADLKGCLDAFAQEIFDRPLDVRYRSSYFPFTEPSLEMDVSCVACEGRDPQCRICKGSGWLEISGLGMVHPNVLRSGGIDPDEFNGFAWGMGLDRIAMLKYGLKDLRILFEGDASYLTHGRVY